MKRTHAAAIAAATSLMTAGVCGRIVAGPTASVPQRPTVAAPTAPPVRRALETIPQASLYLSLRMQGGRMYAVNGSGGGDADVTPRIILGPEQAKTPSVLVLPTPPPPGTRTMPLPTLPKAPPPAPHR